MVGRGTHADPKRPMYAPLPVAGQAVGRSGIIAFQHMPSDDKNFAIVEFVAADRNAFKSILADKSFRVFEKGKDSKASIEAEMQKYRKGFSLDHFGVAVR